jgi:hypothetical protein
MRRQSKSPTRRDTFAGGSRRPHVLQTKRLHFGHNLQRAKALRRKYLRAINKSAFLHASIAAGPLLNMRAGAGARFEHPRATPGISAIGDVSLQDTVHH